MNRQDIIDMLESIGVTAMAMRPTSFKGYVDVFQKFADLVAEKEREAYNRENNAAWKLMCEKMVNAEREACANVAKAISDKYGYGYYGNEVDTADEIEAAIRARGAK